jgi:hypothetical protein
LRVFEYNSELRSLSIMGNADLGDYKCLILYITRYLRGTNRSLGLVELDGELVSMVIGDIGDSHVT